jgi:type I restriction enzyme, S subunit
MIADLKPYPALKDFDDLRIGEVPEHWEIEPLCAIAKLKSVKNQHDRELLSVYLNLGVVPFATVKEKRTNATSEDLSGYQAVDPGDFVLNNQQAWRGSVGVSMHKGIVSPAYLVLSLGSRIHPRYANLLLRERSMVAQYLIASKGVGSIQRNLYWPHLKRIPIILPPLSEQSSIVRFLDHIDRKIRRYIRAKQKLIKLLEEQKQAIIHRAVTRGLDPNVRLKPSGVEWLGDVPEHWLVLRAKYLFREVDSRSEAGTETHLAMSQKLGLVPSSMVQSTLRSESYAGGKLCTIGDLVLNRLKAHLGVFAVAKQSGVISPDYTILRKQNGAHAEYFECILRSPACRGELRIRAKGIVEGFWRLYTDDFYKICLPVPPLREQQQIMESIAHQTREQAGAISRLECEISLLREYRTRLIADFVTGKLDVRGAAAQLPDEDQELPAIDELEDISDSEEDAPDDLEEALEDPEP